MNILVFVLVGLLPIAAGLLFSYLTRNFDGPKEDILGVALAAAFTWFYVWIVIEPILGLGTGPHWGWIAWGFLVYLTSRSGYRHFSA